MNTMNNKIEKRVNMALMAKQVNKIYKAIYDDDDGNEGWLTARVTKNSDDIKQIKTVWSTCTVIGTVVVNFLTRRL